MTSVQTITYLENKLNHRPFVSEESLEDVLSRCYGFEIDGNVQPKQLVSYEDRNFLIQGVHKYYFINLEKLKNYIHHFWANNLVKKVLKLG